MMAKAKAIYLGVIDLEGAGKKAARKAALERSHDVRQFEIELYWKRANYFWLLQAAVFAAVGLTWRSEANLPAYLPVALSSLGVLTAHAGWLATQGSKFWQRNWEHHIDMLEGEFEGDLYKTVCINESGVRWSLSGVSETLAMFFWIFWIFVLLATALNANPEWDFSPANAGKPNSIEVITIGFFIATAAGCALLYSRRGGIKGDLTPYPTDFTLGEKYTRRRLAKGDENAPRVLMRREPGIR